MIVDTSAVVAILKAEPGSERAIEALPGAVISIVNLVEIFEAMRRKNLKISRRMIEDMLADANVTTICPNVATGSLAADIYASDPPAGMRRLSLGDAFCLGHAVELDIPALTADQSWAAMAFPHPVKIELIR